jgi:hypothetical protein
MGYLIALVGFLSYQLHMMGVLGDTGSPPPATITSKPLAAAPTISPV